MSNDMNWFCVWVPPQAEFSCDKELRLMGFEAFVPVEYKWAARSRNPRNKTKVRRAYPLLVRYVFVGFPGEVRWDPIINHDRYYMRPVGMRSDKPYQFTQEQISVLSSLATRSLPYAAAPNPHKAALSVQPGDTARIVDTAFFGHVGKVDSVIADRARVIINIFGSFRPVEVKVSDLEAA